MTSAPKHSHRLPKFIRIIKARPRLFISALVGLAALLVLPWDWRPAIRLVTAWDMGVGLYLILALHLMAQSDVATIRRHAATQDEGQVAILGLTVAAAIASLAAIIAVLGTSAAGTGGRPPLHLTLAMLTIVLSWAFIHTMFTLHYAHEFYVERRGHVAGLAFPGNDEPDFWDFLYFSVVIGMTSQVSDVTIASKPIRRTVTAHGVVSFFFNAALIALTVNIAASAI
ncbi:MAG TPA: DUF1345 domain-containing protein [Xanthobacteraceae bacterium]|jgi:uncharacterized membrane protein|nr:DUF1345 domain-containing protein [Xanthobacteraceae bacterium]